MPENNGKKMYIIAFSVIVIIIGVVFTWLFNAFGRTETKVSEYQAQMEEVRACVNNMQVDIGTIKESLIWIKDALNKKTIK